MSNPYQVHNFNDTQKLYAQDLNEMDAQIAINDAACRNFNVNTINSRINTLRLDTDGTNIILLFDGVEIASVAIADVNNIIFAEGLSVTSSLNLTLMAGNTSQITYAVTPNNANQKVRFRSNNLDILNVNNTGLITALRLGITSVSVICGEFNVQIQVFVSEQKFPTWRIGNYLSSSSSNFRMLVSEDTRLIAFPTEDDNLYLKTGDTINITMNTVNNNIGYISQAYAIPSTGTSFDIDTINEVPIINISGNNTATDISSSISNYRSLTYTASADCYISFAIGGIASHYTQSEADSFNTDGYCTIIISPASST